MSADDKDAQRRKDSAKSAQKTLTDPETSNPFMP